MLNFTQTRSEAAEKAAKPAVKYVQARPTLFADKAPDISAEETVDDADSVVSHHAEHTDQTEHSGPTYVFLPAEAFVTMWIILSVHQGSCVGLHFINNGGFTFPFHATLLKKSELLSIATVPAFPNATTATQRKQRRKDERYAKFLSLGKKPLAASAPIALPDDEQLYLFFSTCQFLTQNDECNSIIY